MMVSPTVWPLLSLRSQGYKMKSSSFLANMASRATDTWGGTIMEVSTIPDSRAVIMVGLPGSRLGGYTPTIAGDTGGFGTLSGFAGLPISRDGDVDEISRMAGWGSRDISLDFMASLVCGAVSPATSALGPRAFHVSSSRGLFVGLSWGFPVNVRFWVIRQIFSTENFMFAPAKKPG